MGIIYPRRPLTLLRGQSNATTVFTGSNTTINFSATIPNGGSYSSGTYTFAHTGLIWVNATVYLNTTVAASNCVIQANGSQVWTGYVSLNGSGTDWSPIATVNYVTQYSAGDTVYINCSNSTGAMRLLGSTVGALSTLSIVLLE